MLSEEMCCCCFFADWLTYVRHKNYQTGMSIKTVIKKFNCRQCLFAVRVVKPVLQGCLLSHCVVDRHAYTNYGHRFQPQATGRRRQPTAWPVVVQECNVHARVTGTRLSSIPGKITPHWICTHQHRSPAHL